MRSLLTLLSTMSVNFSSNRKKVQGTATEQQFQLWNSPVKNWLDFKLDIHEFKQVTPTVK
jgi:hypothetical protein